MRSRLCTKLDVLRWGRVSNVEYYMPYLSALEEFTGNLKILGSVASTEKQHEYHSWCILAKTSTLIHVNLSD